VGRRPRWASAGTSIRFTVADHVEKEFQLEDDGDEVESRSSSREPASG
jgi:hypothetical protein